MGVLSQIAEIQPVNLIGVRLASLALQGLQLRRFGIGPLDSLSFVHIFGTNHPMQTFYEPDPGPDSPATVRMIVEIPKDSTNKYEYDHTLGVFRLSRTLYSPMHYSGDYGFIPGTIAEDNEPLDILCLVSSRSFTGCLAYVHPVAILDMLDGPDVDHKVIAVPARDPRYDKVEDLSYIEPHVRRELEHFFQIYKELEGRTMQTRSWGDRAEAQRIIKDSRERYLATRKSPNSNLLQSSTHSS